MSAITYYFCSGRAWNTQGIFFLRLRDHPVLELANICCSKLHSIFKSDFICILWRISRKGHSRWHSRVLIFLEKSSLQGRICILTSSGTTFYNVKFVCWCFLWRLSHQKVICLEVGLCRDCFTETVRGNASQFCIHLCGRTIDAVGVWWNLEA